MFDLDRTNIREMEHPTLEDMYTVPAGKDRIFKIIAINREMVCNKLLTSKGLSETRHKIYFY